MGKKNIYNDVVSDKIKLHLGCGKNMLPGWINTDFPPKKENILELDATKKFPFEDNSIDYVFSEHMIEHISFEDGFLQLESMTFEGTKK